MKTTNYDDAEWRAGFVQDQEKHLQGTLANQIRVSDYVKEDGVDMVGLTDLLKPLGRIGQMIINRAKKLNADRTHELDALRTARDAQREVVSSMGQELAQNGRVSQQRVDDAQELLAQFTGMRDRIDRAKGRYRDMIDRWGFNKLVETIALDEQPEVDVGLWCAITNWWSGNDAQANADELWTHSRQFISGIDQGNDTAKKLLAIQYLKNNCAELHDELYTLHNKFKNRKQWPSNKVILREDVDRYCDVVVNLLNRLEAHCRSTIQSNRKSDARQDERIRQARKQLSMLEDSLRETGSLEYWCRRLSSFTGLKYTHEDLCELSWQLGTRYRHQLQMVCLFDQGLEGDPSAVLSIVEQQQDYLPLVKLMAICK
jgi:hypothetical protein